MSLKTKNISVTELVFDHHKNCVYNFKFLRILYNLIY